MMQSWKRIPLFSDYKISTDGDVAKGNDTLRPTVTDGRRYVVLVGDDGKRYNRSVGWLVLVTFRGRPVEPYDKVIHGDAGPLDDSLGNVRWGTFKELSGTIIRRPRSRGKALTAAEAKDAARRITSKDSSLRAEAARLGVSRSTLTLELDRLCLRPGVAAPAP